MDEFVSTIDLHERLADAQGLALALSKELRSIQSSMRAGSGGAVRWAVAVGHVAEIDEDLRRLGQHVFVSLMEGDASRRACLPGQY